MEPRGYPRREVYVGAVSHRVYEIPVRHISVQHKHDTASPILDTDATASRTRCHNNASSHMVPSTTSTSLSYGHARECINGNRKFTRKLARGASPRVTNNAVEYEEGCCKNSAAEVSRPLRMGSFWSGCQSSYFYLLSS